MTLRSRNRMAWAVFNRVVGDNISTFSEAEVGMWERIEYLRAWHFQESPRRPMWLEHLGEVIAMV